MKRELKQLLFSFFSLLFIFSLIFFIVRLAPGSPFDTEAAFPPEIKAALQEKYGLNQSLQNQYWTYLKDFFSGNLGYSLKYYGEVKVSALISESIGISLWVGTGALFLSLILGITLGVMAARKSGQALDSVINFFVVSGLSIPVYLSATFLVYLFAIHLKVFPVALYEGTASLILPILTLTIRPLSFITRLIRTEMKEIMKTSFIPAARSKGVHEMKILFLHALPNALGPVLSIIGPLGASLLAGSFIVENIFSLPGLGRYFVSSVIDRDYPMIMAISQIYAVLLVSLNFLSDLLSRWIDPRVSTWKIE